MLTTVNHIEQTDLNARIQKAAHWLVKSGVQVVSDNPLNEGGYVCWYEQDTQIMPYVYSEITGYLVTMMCFLYKQTGEIQYLNSAIRAGDWLVRTAHEPTGGFRCLFPLAPSRFEYKNNQIYAFDCGVILNGLVELYRATHNPKYLAASVSVGDWLVQDVQKLDGAFRPVFDIEKGEFIESDKEWSLCSGSYHTKVAIGLTNLYDVTRQEKYLRSAIKGCDFALTFLQPDGRFVSFPSEGGTNSHPHAYSAEGLWVVGKYLDREDYLQASARATNWLLEWQSPEGYVPRHFHNGEPVYNERVDILSQSLRLAAIHLGEKRLPEELKAKLPALVAVVSRNQAASDDARVNGAFYFGRLSSGEIMPHANVWVTSFAMQGLHLFEQLSQDTFNFHHFHMV